MGQHTSSTFLGIPVYSSVGKHLTSRTEKNSKNRPESPRQLLNHPTSRIFHTGRVPEPCPGNDLDYSRSSSPPHAGRPVSLEINCFVMPQNAL